ncbi:energy-coupling factor transport system permease protein [Bacillus sp. V-88]|uniref:energy-coupling factor transporter transmembrane component T family protein n=1 Tax=Rossellomorea vietnamensis TaxID=218284 RepID=UPI000550357C|nr:energy-coupling factor transporter transmembrane component T [Rossellomorea vietnamensis]OXS60177.1 ABC transporter permease [Bacillus sp. DSM 27956]PRX76387.1 energy-coupling factor transport system permease protein [Bacillus sp. V-88]SLK23082.1 energy-coupling factor transport system permease protein [Bacillus sp. V-88]
MNMELVHKHTWLHRINPSMKLIVMIALFLFLLFVHYLNWLVYMTLFAFLLLWSFSGYSKRVVTLMAMPFFLVFLSTASSMIMFGKGETTWFTWGMVHVTEESFYRGFHIGLRAFLFSVLGLMFALTTRPVLLFYSLMQQLCLKPKYAYSFMAGIRLIPIMMEEFTTIRNALKVRGNRERTGYKKFFHTIESYSIPLLAQSIRRAHRIAVAMDTKGFDGERERTYFYKVGFSKFDSYFMGSIILMVSVSYILSIYLPLFPTGDVRYGN